MAIYLGSNKVELITDCVIQEELRYDTSETVDNNIINTLDELGWTDCYTSD